MNFLDNYQEHAYTLLRIFSGFLFMTHGAQKCFNFPTEFPYGPLNTLVVVTGGIELVGGLFIMIGLLTRPTAFVCSGMMATAYWLGHGFHHFFPIANGGELAVMFCFIFLLIATRGAGIWSVDQAHS